MLHKQLDSSQLPAILCLTDWHAGHPLHCVGEEVDKGQGSSNCSQCLFAPSVSCSCPSSFKFMGDIAAHSLDMLCVVVIETPVVLQEFVTETRPTGREQERSAERTSEASSSLPCSVAIAPLPPCCTLGRPQLSFCTTHLLLSLKLLPAIWLSE